MTQFRTALSVISVVSILFSTPSLSYAGLICGGSKIEVINSSNQKEPHFLVQISKGERTLKVPYSAEQEFLFLRCEQNAEGKPFFISK